jgi:integrase
MRVRSVEAKAGASYINHELNTLTQILHIAGQWDRMKRFYNPLPLPKKRPQRVMTEEEEQQLFEAASKNAECYLAYLVASISANTTATGAELRSLQLRHISLDENEPAIEIPHEMVKNEYRARRIPLNEIALKQVRRAVERAQYIGCVHATDHVFPLRVKPGLYDPGRPASPSWIRKQWQVLRQASPACRGYARTICATRR